jgi:hypothetical protein
MSESVFPEVIPEVGKVVRITIPNDPSFQIEGVVAFREHHGGVFEIRLISQPNELTICWKSHCQQWQLALSAGSWNPATVTVIR